MVKTRKRGIITGEIKVYTVAVGNINPLSRKSRAAVKYIAKLKGLIGVKPYYPRGTLLFFESENAAKVAKNQMESKGIHTGRNITECFIDERYKNEHQEIK